MNRVSPCTSLCVSRSGFSCLWPHTSVRAYLQAVLHLLRDEEGKTVCRDHLWGTLQGRCTGGAPLTRKRWSRSLSPAVGRAGSSGSRRRGPGGCAASLLYEEGAGHPSAAQGFLNTAFTIRQHPSAQHSSSKSFFPQAWDTIRLFLGHFFLVVCFQPHPPEVLTFLT